MLLDAVHLWQGCEWWQHSFLHDLIFLSKSTGEGLVLGPETFVSLARTTAVIKTIESSRSATPARMIMRVSFNPHELQSPRSPQTHTFIEFKVSMIVITSEPAAPVCQPWLHAYFKMGSSQTSHFCAQVLQRRFINCIISVRHLRNSALLSRPQYQRQSCVF